MNHLSQIVLNLFCVQFGPSILKKLQKAIFSHFSCEAFTKKNLKLP